MDGVSSTEKEIELLKQTSLLEEQVTSLQLELQRERESNLAKTHVNQLEQQVIQLQEQQPNWERQITEIIDWVSNEKEARNYLQQMAATMTKELENLKQQHELQKEHEEHERIYGRITPQTHSEQMTKNGVSKYSTSTWQERRSARVDKQELLQLQLDLANEIEDKQRIQVELTRVQKELNAVIQEWNETKQEMMARVQEQKRRSLLHNTSSGLFSSNQTSGPSILPAFDSMSPASIVKEMVKHSISGPTFMDSDAGSDLDLSEDRSSCSDVKTVSSQSKHHSFLIRTFVAPLKCNHCTSLMVGLIRQGLVCEVCGFACHVSCAANSGQQQCPCDDARQRPVGIDPQKGIGTAYEGYVKIPRAKGGVRKGWIRMFVVVCDFKLFLYDLNSSGDISGLASSHGSNGSGESSGSGVTPFVSVNTLIDMRSVDFLLLYSPLLALCIEGRISQPYFYSMSV